MEKYFTAGLEKFSTCVKHLFQSHFPVLLFTGLLFVSSSAYSQQTDDLIHFTILHTNDEHSHLIPHPAIDDNPDLLNPTVGGFARLAGAVNRIKEQKAEAGEPVMIFSGGDILGGPAFGWLPLKEGLAPELTLLQKIGYDAVTIGNHEFDYGPDVLAEYLKAAGYPEAKSKTRFLGTNTRPPSDHPLSDMDIQNHYVKELKNGFRVGVLGLLGDDAISKTSQPGAVEFSDPIQSAKEAIAALQDSTVDIIISVNHSGVYEDQLLAREVPEIDIIVGGHSHTPLYEPIIENGTIIVQAGSYLEYLGRIELSWNTQSGEISIRNQEENKPFLIRLDSEVEVDPVIAQEVANYRETLNAWVAELTDERITTITQPVAESSFIIERNKPQRESAIGNYITDAMRMAAQNIAGKNVDIAVQANGAIRANIKPGTQEWSENRISFYDLMMSTGLGAGPDGNPGYPLVSFYLTEGEVRNALEVSVLLSELLGDNYFLQFSGLRMMYDPNRAVLMNIPFRGTPIPTSMAVLGAELERENEENRPLKKDGEELLHIVSDYYIASFLPMIGERLPQLSIELKDEYGTPIELDDSIVYTNGEELKVWQTVLEYTLSHELGDLDLPVIPEQYAGPEERLKVVYTLPLWVWPLLILAFIIALVAWIIRSRKKQ